MVKKNIKDVYYPVPQDFTPICSEKPSTNHDVVRRIIQGSVKTAYGLKEPSAYELKYGEAGKEALATQEQVEMVMHFIESLQPADAIEAALASQFAISYIRAMEAKNYDGTPMMNIELFEFGHKVLLALQQYRSKGAQLISVQYNVNQGQVVNIKNVRKGENPASPDGECI